MQAGIYLFGCLNLAEMVKVKNMADHLELSAKEIIRIKSAMLAAMRSGEFTTLSEVCKAVEVSHWNAWKLLALDEAFKCDFEEARVSARDVFLDMCEEKLKANAKDRDNDAIKFTLRQQGGKRGWNDKLHITQEVNVDIDVSEAARRIAFAMNAALDKGVMIDTDYREIVKDVPAVGYNASNSMVIKARELCPELKGKRIPHAPRAKERKLKQIKEAMQPSA